MDPQRSMPPALDAGTSLHVVLAYPDFPASAWTAELWLGGGALVAPVKADGTPLSDAFDFEFAAAETSAWVAGVYQWQVRVTSSSGVLTADRGQLTVRPNLATALAGDLQPWEERALAAVTKVIEGRIDADVQQFTIAGRLVEQIPVKELFAIRRRLKAALTRARHPGRLGTPVLARIGRVQP